MTDRPGDIRPPAQLAPRLRQFHPRGYETRSDPAQFDMDRLIGRWRKIQADKGRQIIPDLLIAQVSRHNTAEHPVAIIRVTPFRQHAQELGTIFANGRSSAESRVGKEWDRKC